MSSAAEHPGAVVLPRGSTLAPDTFVIPPPSKDESPGVLFDRLLALPEHHRCTLLFRAFGMAEGILEHDPRASLSDYFACVSRLLPRYERANR